MVSPGTAGRWFCAAWPARIMDGRAEGPCTDAFEIICCDCGDDPDLDYSAVSPKLQLVRGPYPIEEGVRAYQAHLRLHPD